MNHRPIIDAGPSLNFLSINKERLLIAVLGKLSAPEAVQEEVFRKSSQDGRFQAAEKTWKKLTPTWIEVLPDDQTPKMSAVVHRITQKPMEQRMREPKDLGEIMVIAHAVVAAEAGKSVNVLIDDGTGAKIATSEIKRLERLRGTNPSVGSISLVSTLTVLESAAGKEHIPDKGEMRSIYTRLRGLDDGLPPIEKTNLLTSTCWP